MSDISKRRQEAETAFRKLRKAGPGNDKSEAQQDHDAKAKADLAKSERLKQLRLAKEAADLQVAPRPRRPGKSRT